VKRAESKDKLQRIESAADQCQTLHEMSVVEPLASIAAITSDTAKHTRNEQRNNATEIS